MTTVSSRPTGGQAADAADAGWSPWDEAWEETQQRALERYRQGQGAAAAGLWRRGLAIARRHFPTDDPRLAASLANAAFALHRSREPERARAPFEEALAVWERAWSWILYMRPLAGAEAGGPLLDRRAREAFERQAARGREATLDLRRGQPTAEDGLAEWKRSRPSEGSDARRLMAAVLLLVSRPLDGR